MQYDQWPAYLITASSIINKLMILKMHYAMTASLHDKCHKCILDALIAQETRLVAANVVYFPFLNSVRFLVICQSWIPGAGLLSPNALWL